MIILWIDPWTTTVGFAFVEKIDKKIRVIEYWVISTPPKISLAEKLLLIHNDLQELLDIYKPVVAWVEKLFFLRNVTTGIDVAQARGVMMHLFASRGIIIHEYTPLQVKQGITGNGNAKKQQLQNAITLLCWLQEIPKPDDAADALAIAYLTALQTNSIL